MNGVTRNDVFLPAMAEEFRKNVAAFERGLLEREQIPATTHHLLHAGMYTRTLTIPAGAALTGALVKIPTTLVISGDVMVYTGPGAVRLKGHNVVPASAGRKQAFLAYEDTTITMSFPTKARTVEEAEREFTDEHERLFSRHGENVTNITGE